MIAGSVHWRQGEIFASAALKLLKKGVMRSWAYKVCGVLGHSSDKYLHYLNIAIIDTSRRDRELDKPTTYREHHYVKHSNEYARRRYNCGGK